jgi:hypothetical protein
MLPKVELDLQACLPKLTFPEDERSLRVQLHIF